MAIMDINNKVQSATPWGAIAGVAGSVIGALTANTRRKQQMADQKRLMELQQKNQMALNQQGADLAKENWNYTNAENQVKHYENAGLNVGLMYGGSGAGGTLSSGSGGGAAGGNAPVPESIGGQLGIMGIQTQQMINQTELIKAQKENIEADTKLKLEDAGKKGAETEGIALANAFEALLQQADQDGKGGEPLKLQKYKGEISTILKGLRKTEADINNVNANTVNTNADTELKKQLKEFKDKANPQELEQMKIELEKFKANPSNNQYVMWIEKILGLLGGVTNIIK
ncbi:putative VP2, partial [Microviridae sp.]